MSSGHMAGMQRGEDFSKAEADIQKRRKQEAQLMVDKYGTGETVYRDKSGKKVDGPQEVNDGNQKRPPELSKEEQRLLNTGRVQREK